MSNIIIPQVEPLNYCGQMVLSTPQLAAIFRCKRHNITVNFRNNRQFFTEGEDFFFLKGDEFKSFRQNLIMGENADKLFEAQSFSPQNAGKLFEAQSFIPPFARGATNAYLWTQPGVEKLAKIINTDNAKLIYLQLKLQYFNSEGKIIAPQNIAPLSDREKIDRLIKLAELTTDTSLREDIIKKAVALI